MRWRPGPVSLPARLLVCEAVIAIAILASAPWFASAWPHPANTAVAAVIGAAVGWQLREAWVAWRNHRKLSRLRREQQDGVAALFTQQLRERIARGSNTEETTK